MITPAIYTLLTKWADPDKRSRMISIVYVGKAIGAIVSNYTSSWICSSYKIGGWPMSYYIYSMFGAVLSIIWITGVSESPDQDKRKSQTITPNKSIPLYDIFTSKPVWAIAIAKFASNFGYYFLLIEAPTLFSTILGVDVRTIGYLTLIPNCTIVVTGLLFAAAADYIIQQKYLSILNTRKLFVLLGFGISSACFCAVVFAGHSVVVVEILYIVISAVYGCNYASVLPNPMDITIEYSGVVAGVTQTIVSCSGFLLPIVIGLVINEENTLKQWILLFLITGGVELFGMFFFLIFAEAEQQEWSSNNEHIEEEKRSLINRK
ncbi:sialin-like [Antedon mediterranea]|uniref:sialin-like n=1 Tax=Antedon mediterranea TaxID=105859 RepID=UPI003AF8EA07